MEAVSHHYLCRVRDAFERNQQQGYASATFPETARISKSYANRMLINLKLTQWNQKYTVRIINYKKNKLVQFKV